MGVPIGAIVPRKQLRIEELKGRKVAVDTFIELYQFLRTLPKLTDKKGNITTHLVGLFFRTINVLSYGIKPCFVLDGPFIEVGMPAKPVATRITGTITERVIEDTKTLLNLLGLPIIQAPSEAEAQAAFMNKKKDVWAVVSQDYDSLIFGADRMIKNLTLAKERKLPKGGKVLIGTYLIECKDLLEKFNLSQDQLMVLALLVGTDFNPGVYGIGPKKGIKLLHKHGNDFDNLFKEAGWTHHYSRKEVFNHIKAMPVTNEYLLRWKKPDKERITEFLVNQKDFNKNRVENALAKI